METLIKDPVAEASSEWSLVSYPLYGSQRRGACAYKIYRAGTYGKSRIIVMAEPYGYSGMSITNAAEQAAGAIVRKENLNPGRCIWVEHYSAHLEYRSSLDESFALMTFKWTQIRRAGLTASWTARGADWRHTTRETVEAIIGDEIPEVVPAGRRKDNVD